MSKEIAEKYWSIIQKQNYKALADLFMPDAIIDWPNTNERFTVEEFIHVNEVYPGNWKEEITVILETPDGCVCECWVGNEEISFYAISNLHVLDGKISYMREYWCTNGRPPAWRAGKYEKDK